MARKTVVPGSDGILKWLDDHVDGSFKFYPEGFDNVKELESKFDRLALWIIFWHWVSDVGYNRTISPKVKSMLPCCIRCCVSPSSLPPVKFNRKRFRELILQKLPEVFDAAQKVDNDKALNLFKDELRAISALFTSDEQRFVAGTPHPSAADLMLAGCLHSLYDHLEDADINPCVPGFLDEDGFGRLKNFFMMMKSTYPLCFNPQKKKPTKKAKE